MKSSILQCLVSIILFSIALSPKPIHKFEDGFIERNCAVVVNGNKATVQYQIGLNEKTIQDLLTQWAAEKLDDSEPASQTKKLDKTRQENESAKSAQSQTPTKLPDTNSKAVKPNVEQDVEQDVEPITTTDVKEQVKKFDSSGSTPSQTRALKNQDTKPKSLSESQPNTERSVKAIESEEDVITLEILEKFRMVAGEEIARRFKVTCDNKLVPAKNIQVEKAPRHPYVLLIKFELDLPSFETAELFISDSNFRSKTGAVRYALKAVEDTMLLKSNVAPIVIRAKRVELSGLSAKETVNKTSISARLAIMSTSK